MSHFGACFFVYHPQFNLDHFGKLFKLPNGMKKLVVYVCNLIRLILMGSSISIGFAQTDSADPFDPKNPSPILPDEPDHLTPVDPYQEDLHAKYINLLSSKLKLNSNYFARMVIRPSFSGESAIRIHGQADDRDIEKTSKFLITYTFAEKSIWYAMAENNEEKKEQTVEVTTIIADIPALFAQRLCELWKKMLLRSRIPSDPILGLDGVRIEFSTPLGYGETWTPQQRKSPLLFVQLGESLIRYCKAKPKHREQLLKEAEQMAENLENYLEENPLK